MTKTETKTSLQTEPLEKTQVDIDGTQKWITTTFLPKWQEYIIQNWWENTLNNFENNCNTALKLINSINEKLKIQDNDSMQLNSWQLLLTEFTSKIDETNNINSIIDELEQLLDSVLNLWNTQLKNKTDNIYSNKENSYYQQRESLESKLQKIKINLEEIIKKCEIFKSIINNSWINNERLSWNQHLCSITPEWKSFQTIFNIIKELEKVLNTISL